MTTITEPIEIQVDNRRVLDDRLNDAVRGLQQLAMTTGTHGILLTRHKPGQSASSARTTRNASSAHSTSPPSSRQNTQSISNL